MFRSSPPGCRGTSHRLPLVCPRDVSCPPDIDLFCRDYNFLMILYMFQIVSPGLPRTSCCPDIDLLCRDYNFLMIFHMFRSSPWFARGTYRLPLVCPRDVTCPPDIDLLCRDYNFLMIFHMFQIVSPWFARGTCRVLPKLTCSVVTTTF
ncbi:hypothetical protein J6590_102165 [Homalodisca vitripennis]|nr:hypothetical protein J6590_102165 [Homalodisca vitripennis]